MRPPSPVPLQLGLILLLIVALARVTQGFVVVVPRQQMGRPSCRQTVVSMSSTEIDESSLGLTPRLLEVSRAFQLMDERTRVQHLLAMAGALKPFRDFRKLPENKVPGCLSTVYVHAYLKEGKVYFEGDSDAQLTKGLVALLIEGMSGCESHEIQAVKPEFIKFAGIAASLTPG
jgi:cysteine desulfuration protein SufE|eukprot:evm.model.NODE_21584_length_11053_cov_29.592690.3